MRRLKLSKRTGIAVSLLAALSAPGLWLYRSHTNTVEVDAGVFKTALGIDRIITPTLSEKIKRNPRAGKFRLRWILLGNPKGPLHCQIDYDRTSGQLNELSIHTGMDHRRVYMNVTDDAIHKVALGGRPLHRLRAHGAIIGSQPRLMGLIKRYRFRWFGW